MQSARFKEYGQKVLTNELYIMINEISITVKLFVAETLQSIQLWQFYTFDFPRSIYDLHEKSTYKLEFFDWI